ncbi:MAG TPA: thioredoxin family protein [Kofleriaceae bacterium]|nr:thioredoxin family protein [Kofleriaceae bacterium]
MKRALLLLLVACGHGGGAPVGPAPATIDAGAPDAAPVAEVAVDAAPVAIAPPDAAPAIVKPPPPKGPPKVLQINQTGEIVDIDKFVVADHVTIVDFWATWCGGCKVMEAKFMDAIGTNPRVVVRKVDVGDGDTPVAKKYNVKGLPQVWIYDQKKRLRYVLVANDALKVGDYASDLAKSAN